MSRWLRGAPSPGKGRRGVCVCVDICLSGCVRVCDEYLCFWMCLGACVHFSGNVYLCVCVRARFSLGVHVSCAHVCMTVSVCVYLP